MWQREKALRGNSPSCLEGCGRPKTEMLLHYLLAKATWKIKIKAKTGKRFVFTKMLTLCLKRFTTTIKIVIVKNFIEKCLFYLQNLLKSILQ